MKISRTFLALASVAVLLAGSSCTQDQSQSQTARAAHHSDQDDSDKPPFIGMTEQQAHDRYGDPKQRVLRDDGEQWFYVLNEGEVFGKSLIPFYFGGRRFRTATLYFGRNGRLERFHWDPENQG